MPYKSDAQRRFFHANADELRRQGVDVSEWDRASKGRDVPERVHPRSEAARRCGKDRLPG
jgi:hypothetical protein